MTRAPAVTVPADGDGGGASRGGSARPRVAEARTGSVAKGAATHPGHADTPTSATARTTSRRQELQRGATFEHRGASVFRLMSQPRRWRRPHRCDGELVPHRRVRTASMTPSDATTATLAQGLRAPLRSPAPPRSRSCDARRTRGTPRASCTRRPPACPGRSPGSAPARSHTRGRRSAGRHGARRARSAAAAPAARRRRRRRRARMRRPTGTQRAARWKDARAAATSSAESDAGEEREGSWARRARWARRVWWARQVSTRP